MRIAITGAGLSGRFVSLLLNQLCPEFSITLFDARPLCNARATGRIAAAMVAPLAESVDASEQVTKMGFWSVDAWPRLLETMKLETPFHQSGSLVVAHRQDDAEYQQFLRRLKHSPNCGPDQLNQPLLEMLEPELSNQFTKGLFLPKEGHIDNGLLFDELERFINNSNIKMYTGEQVSVNQITQLFDQVIDCRGIGAKNELANSRKSLRGVRGEVIRVYAPDVNLNRPVRLMHPRYPLYIVPKAKQHYVIGATQIESEHQGNVTVRSALELLSAAYSLHTGFSEAEITSIDVGLRPTLQHNNPEIYVQNKLIQVNGLFRHGFMVLPYVLNQLLKILKVHSPFSLGSTETDNTLVQHYENFN